MVEICVFTPEACHFFILFWAPHSPSRVRHHFESEFNALHRNNNLTNWPRLNEN
jgi:hypothetical protein